LAQAGRAAINYGPKLAEKAGKIGSRISEARKARQAAKAAQASKAAKAATLGDDAVKASTKTGVLGKITSTVSNFGKSIVDNFKEGRQLAGGVNTQATGISQRIGKGYQTAKNTISPMTDAVGATYNSVKSKAADLGAGAKKFAQPALDLADNTVGRVYRGARGFAGAIGGGIKNTVGAVGSGIKATAGAIGKGGSYLANSAAGQATGQFTKGLFTKGLGASGSMLAKGTGGMGASTAIDGVSLA
jgi:hypothetical protein